MENFEEERNDEEDNNKLLNEINEKDIKAKLIDDKEYKKEITDLKQKNKL